MPFPDDAFWVEVRVVDKATGEAVPLLVWTQSSLVTYYVWRMSASGAGWRLPWWATALEFGTMAAAALWLIRLVAARQTDA